MEATTSMFVTAHMTAWTNMSVVLVFVAFAVFIIMVICLEDCYVYCYAYLCTSVYCDFSDFTNILPFSFFLYLFCPDSTST